MTTPFLRRVFAIGAVAALATLPYRSAARAESEPARRDSPWDDVTVRVATIRASSAELPFSQTILWWLADSDTMPGAGVQRIDIGHDLTENRIVPQGSVVHIRGNLGARLEVGDQSEIVVGGSILKGARIEAAGLVFLFVLGDVDGVVACRGMSRLWIDGSMRGEILTGHPSMSLHVRRDLLGIVHPNADASPGAGPGLLSIDVQGHSPSRTIIAIDQHRYTQLDVAVEASDLPRGFHHLWSGGIGYVAIRSLRPIAPQ